MKSSVAAIVCLLVMGTASSYAMDMPAPHTNAGFDKMKQLVGEWQGKKEDGKPIVTRYELMSSGSAIVEHQSMGDEPEMVTVYYCDGPKLMLTHYCSIGNQPRMRAMPMAAGSKRMRFDFVDVTNLANKADPYMHDLTVQFDDADHVTEEWALHQKGASLVVPIKLERKK